MADNDTNRTNRSQKRDIGCVDLSTRDVDRHESCRWNFRAFCETYFPNEFTLGWSSDHLVVIDKIQRTVLAGELFALAMPRGNGKTTLAEKAVEWSTLYGHRRFVAIIGSDKPAAANIVLSIQTDLESNDALAEDFPEVCEPIRKLEGLAQRAAGQTSNGEPTNIILRAGLIGTPSCWVVDPDEGETKHTGGAIIKAYGLTGSIRGARHKRDDGESIRPDLVIIDDPQTDASAYSDSQCERRAKLLNGAVLKLAGPGKKIAGIMLCTVIRRDDLVDMILKGKRWNPERMRLVDGMPTNPKLWDEYHKIRSYQSQEEADVFYIEHRGEMDAGINPRWPERIDAGCISAEQAAMHMLQDDPHSFWCEAQNEPPEETDNDGLLSVEEIGRKVNNVVCCGIPVESQDSLVAFVDVGERTLHYAVGAFSKSGFSGSIIDYGRKKVERIGSIEASVTQALTELTAELLGKPWKTEGGTPCNMQRILVDSGDMAPTIYTFCLRNGRGAIVPSRGMGARQRLPQLRPGVDINRDKSTPSWVYSVPHNAAPGTPRVLFFTASQWKSFFHARLSTPVGGPGSLVLFDPGKRSHREFAEHLRAESRARLAREDGTIIEEWHLIAGRPNHWFDCAVGCCLAASTCGCTLEIRSGHNERRKRKSKSGSGAAGGYVRRGY